MKAKELMVGDWVYCEGQPTPDNVTIETIAEDGVWFNGPNYEGAASYDRIFPIPLTPEILEKNGWSDWHEHSRIAKSCYELIDKQTSISFQIIDGQDSIFTQINHYGAGTYELRKYLTYVHELQHALRLCGIDKKIEL